MSVSGTASKTGTQYRNSRMIWQVEEDESKVDVWDVWQGKASGSSRSGMLTRGTFNELFTLAFSCQFTAGLLEVS